MIDKKVVILMILTAVLFAGVPFVTGALFGESGVPLLEQARDYISAGSGAEFAAHFSAITGLSYWLLSGCCDFFYEFDEEGLWDFFYYLFHDGPGRYRFERDVPGTFSI
ncbi:MAG: hypothetical protein LUH49_07190 [Cloacibacillus porcorum]|uniref:hypothetical protein n=1 Tax=Cloacibacillus porcorum TaxID=1197717 RepID=UPI0023F51DF8|nr:hypothetical protein [Cloacibacillus porcorum]MCD7876735.1 hypothetical protein [Cloacibacillus porcorum]